MLTGNSFISDAAGAIYKKYNNTFSDASNLIVLRDHNIVTTMTANITSGLINVASLSRYMSPQPNSFTAQLTDLAGANHRGQLYSKVESLHNQIFSVASIGLTILLSLSYRQARRRKCAHEDAGLLHEQVSSSEDDEELEIDNVVREQVQQLESFIKERCMRNSPDSSVEEIDVAVSEKMRILAVQFLRNTRKGLNLTVQISLLLLEAEWIFIKLNLRSRYIWTLYKKGEILAQFGR